MLRAGSLVFDPPPSGPSTCATGASGGLFKFGATWRKPYGSGSSRPRASTTTRSSTSPIATPRLMRAWAGKDPCRPKPSGNSPPRRAGRRRVRLGRRAHAGWRRTSRQYLAGQLPAREPGEDGFTRTSPGDGFPPNGYGVYDMIGNTWEWTTDFWSRRTTRPMPRRPAACRRTRAAAPGCRELRPAPAGDPHPAQGAEGRLASVRPKLLPALPPRRAPCRAGRYLDQPCRLPLCRSRARLRPPTPP
jgi:sulfatase modifying factor 1